MADANSLLDALVAIKPTMPGPEWKMVTELLEEAHQQGVRIAKSAIRKRLGILLKEGKAEMLRAPRRPSGTGNGIYYRLRNGAK